MSQTPPPTSSVPATSSANDGSGDVTLPQPSQAIPARIPGAASSDTQRLPYWLRQAERFLRVIVRIYLGLLVCFAPWYPPAWDNNPLFMSSPTLTNFIGSGAVRGVVSGLGLLNLWIAMRDAIRPPDAHR